MRLARGRRRYLVAGVALICLIAPASATALPDNRGWEMVSPVDKNGGRIAVAGELAGGGVLQAAADGNSVTYGSAASFGTEAQGAPPASQYLSSRSASGWSMQNISLPLLSGSYETEAQGVPYRLFSADLARALHFNGHRCEVGDPCPRDYYLRESSTGALLLSPSESDLLFAGASPDLRHVVLSTCAALTVDATDGCGAEAPNLYLWEQGGGLELINTASGATLAAQGAAVSTDGSRIYWKDEATGNLYLREGATTKQVDTLAGGGGAFQTATPDGSLAFFTKAGHLYRYDALANLATDITPTGGVAGVLGASTDGAFVYFQDAGALKLWHNATTTTVAAGANATEPTNYPPTTGTSRVSADGSLLFASKAQLTGYDNTDQKTGQPDAELFLHEPGAAQLRCVSCRPTGTRPVGSSTIPGSVPNGSAEGSPDSYKPRVFSNGGQRVFFDSRDVLVNSDTNNDRDVYEWEANGTGSCAKAAGCIDLISSGRAEGGAVFVDASVDGSSVFFITDGSLISSDPGAFDLYVARVGGGFPDPPVPIPCNGDSCQSLPSEPVDPALSTLFAGPGNPKVHYVRKPAKKKCRGKAKCQSEKGKRSGKGHKQLKGAMR